VNIVQFAVGACETSGANLSLALQPVIAQGAAEGISYESVASGGANLCGLGTVGLPMTPANLDTVTAVGGSSTFVRTSGNQLAQSALSASNGGVCLVIGLPAWQAGTPGVVTTGRNVPDVVIPGSVDGVWRSLARWLAIRQQRAVCRLSGHGSREVRLHDGDRKYRPALYATLHKDGYRSGSTNYFFDVTLGCIGAIDRLPVCAKKNYDVASGIGSVGDGFALAMVSRWRSSFAFGKIAPPSK
jgi:hypothetical protein